MTVKHFLLIACLASFGFIFNTPASYAQTTGADIPMHDFAEQETKKKEPEMPPPLKAAIESGAQTRYLGQYHGLNGWVIVKNGRPEFHYATQDGEAIIMGILFDGDGNMVTGEQMRMLRLRDGASTYALSEMVNDDSPKTTTSQQKRRAAPANTATAQNKPQEEAETKEEEVSAADIYYAELEAANWVRIGDPRAPIIYAFIDPDCEHCQRFLREIRTPYVENKVVQLRVLPVGFDKNSLKRAAYLLAAPDPEGQLFRYIDGERKALFPAGDIQTDGAKKNVDLMIKWKLSGTPIITYKSNQGDIRFVRGKPGNVAVLIDEIEAEW